MKIQLTEVKIRDVVKNYKDEAEKGVTGYDDRLIVRPEFQREFLYDSKQKEAVIHSVINNFPLNVMYWSKSGEDSYEVLDGQQRTISIAQYVQGDYSITYNGNNLYFHNLTQDIKDRILDYPLMIYICEGTEQEKLDWFRIVNIAGVQLTEQELRNAVYVGPWLTDAKKRFSKTGCPAYQVASKYMNGSTIRQEYLETAIKWIADRDGVAGVSEYMALHQKDVNANELWMYFKNVITWIETLFPTYRREMKGLPWGILYNRYHSGMYDTDTMEDDIKRLMMDDDVTKKSGIYAYLLSGEEKFLNIRSFTPQMKREAYECQGGICPHCYAEGKEKQQYELSEMEADHITPWSKGGKTNAENCQMICKEHNRKKSGK